MTPLVLRIDRNAGRTTPQCSIHAPLYIINSEIFSEALKNLAFLASA
jgi:hypothetical protein